MKWLAENNWKTLSSDELEFFIGAENFPVKALC